MLFLTTFKLYTWIVYGRKFKSQARYSGLPKTWKYNIKDSMNKSINNWYCKSVFSVNEGTICKTIYKDKNEVVCFDKAAYMKSQ